jgi:F-type H+-transporting ATPase subunit delta
MSDMTVARRYAQALHNEAEQAGTVGQVDQDMAIIQESLEGSRQLVQVFGSPVIPREKKASVLRQLFEKRLRPLTFRFLMLLVEKQREDLFPSVVAAYRRLRDDQQGIAEAFVKTSHPLDAGETARIAERLERLTGRKIRLTASLEPELIGGAVIRVGDTVYDGSVRHQLAALREKLKRGVAISPAGTNHN